MKVAEKGYDAGKYDIQYHEPTSLIEEKNKDDYTYDYIKVSNKKDDKKVKRLRVQSKILYKDLLNINMELLHMYLVTVMPYY